MRHRIRRLLGIACAATALATVATLVTAPGASASPATVPAPVGPWGSFYDPPAVLPGTAPGDVVREQPFVVPLSVPTGDGTLPGSARRIMYRSLDEHDRPVAVTGTYFEPSSPWRGRGPRPLVSLASGTIGAGRQCAPSIALQSLVQYRPPIDASIAYEQFAVDYLLSRGIAVVFTDYLGLGTPGPHPYANRLDSAHAVIDAARTAVRLPRTSLTSASPVAFWGYSQGGHAVAAAAELQPTYAPEMRLVGTYSGAPPVQLADTLARAEGSTLIGAVGYFLNGAVRTNPEIEPVLQRVLNARGRAMMRDTANQCVLQTLGYSFQRSSQWTRSGGSLGTAVMNDPIGRRVVEDQTVGRLTPTSPVLLSSNVNDDAVPTRNVAALASTWCGRGVPVTLDLLPYPPLLPGTAVGHGLPEITNIPGAARWVEDRFSGVPAPRCR
jgi:dienelactone hydrolase